VYYAVLIRTSGSNGDWMNFDYAELNSYISFEGYVNDQDGNHLDGANVNISQNTVISDTTTIADGNYTASPGFYSGTSTLINVTKSGYTQYYASLIPMVAKTVPLNFTLVDSTPTSTGLGIGGVARDGILTGSVITFGYGRPISDATVYLVNTSNGESYTKTTNNAGYYLCDEGASCFLTTKRPYDVWGEKARYDNSPNYTAVAA
jgi:protocatechuate 3,4-dioxygenase beta subunit